VASVIALSLVGDWLNDVLNPRVRGRHLHRPAAGPEKRAADVV